MASTLASNERIWGTYITDDGDDYNISCKKALVNAAGNAAKLGYAAGSANNLGIPNEFKPRKVKCVTAAGVARWVVCYSLLATLWTTPGTTIELDFFGVDTLFTSTKYRRGENAGRSISKSA